MGRQVCVTMPLEVPRHVKVLELIQSSVINTFISQLQ